MAETLAIIPLWYGMVWCGGAGQLLIFECLYMSISVKIIRGIKLWQQI